MRSRLAKGNAYEVEAMVRVTRLALSVVLVVVVCGGCVIVMPPRAMTGGDEALRDSAATAAQREQSAGSEPSSSDALPVQGPLGWEGNYRVAVVQWDHRGNRVFFHIAGSSGKADPVNNPFWTQPASVEIARGYFDLLTLALESGLTIKVHVCGYHLAADGHTKWKVVDHIQIGRDEF